MPQGQANAFSVAMEGWLFEAVPIYWRLLIGSAALCMIYPEHVTDLIGIAVFGVYFVLSFLKRKKNLAVPV